MLMYALWVSPFFAMVIFHRRLWIGVPLAIVLAIAGWFQTCYVVWLGVQEELALIEQMPNPTEADLMYDGVGENVAALFLGWIPPTFMLSCGLGVAFLCRWLARRRARSLEVN